MIRSETVLTANDSLYIIKPIEIVGNTKIPAEAVPRAAPATTTATPTATITAIRAVSEV